jgi:hypothetical protein
MTLDIRQSTQFTIKQLALVTKVGSVDITGLYEEINLFDSVVMPCMSGNIVIRDAVGLTANLLLDGSEYIIVKITKDDLGNGTHFNYDRTFRIYKQTNRKNINQNSEMYVLHFVSSELIFSEQQKINQHFKGNYHTLAKLVLNDYLKVPFQASKIGIMEPTSGIHSIIVPNLSPFNTMNWIIKRAVDMNGLPNYLFYQNKIGYNFVSLSTLLSAASIMDINFRPKNLPNINENEDSMGNEFTGARDYKILSQFNVLDSIRDGVYAGKFIGFDPLMRKKQTHKVNFNDIWDKSKHANKYRSVSTAYNRSGIDPGEMYDGKVSMFPFSSTRINNAYTVKNDIATATIIDNTHNYILQRKSIFSNLMQNRIQITLPGNFALSSGFNVSLDMKSRFNDNGEPNDDSVFGKYLIIASRHVIKYDRHETILEVATDSSSKVFATSTSTELNNAANA